MIATASNVLAVAIGGGLGALGRYGIAVAMTQSSIAKPIHAATQFVGGGASFATTLANLLGCLLLGVLYQWTENMAATAQTPLDPRMMLAIRVGFLGSLTTFSTLIGDAALLGINGRPSPSLVLMSVNLVGGWLLFLAAAATFRGVFS
ncbi:FluC/FEX family fluoride channel [Neorhodopirellula lusitana]|nr:CrcB family protein [Neorhodopirellula lusitana]